MAATLERLIRNQQIVLVGIVLAELLRGMRNDQDSRRVSDMLRGLTYIEIHRDTWEHAGTIAQEMDAKGMTIPITDACIAAIALENGHEILSRDKHFQRIPALRLYQPEGGPDA
jgi:predicted nucleic acid-binding protein